MAAANGTSSADLKQDLLTRGNRFDFFQAIRLLNRLLGERQVLRIRPDLSQGFPASDVVAIEEHPDQSGYQMTTTFLGLYGVSSPLPAFYTEELSRDESSVTRDFLDILHQRLFALLIESWKKYRLFIQVAEARSQAPLNMLYAICGLAGIDTPDGSQEDSYALIRYAGLLGGHPRSTLGLATMLTDFLGGIRAEIIPFLPRTVKIPRDQQLVLGNRQNVLGEDSFVGEEFTDRQGKFRVRIGPLKRPRFRTLLQGGEEHRTVTRLITGYLTDALDYDVELILSGEEIRPICLGEPEWSRLGLDTALFAEAFPGDLSVIFPPTPVEERSVA